MMESVWIDPEGNVLHIGEQWDTDPQPDETGQLVETNPMPEGLRRVEEEVIRLPDGARVVERLAYRYQRQQAYPSIAEQLDQLYHEGEKGWRKAIKKIKDAYPKPEGAL